MAGLIIAESAIFTIFVVAYLFYVGKSLTGPTPREVLEAPNAFELASEPTVDANERLDAVRASLEGCAEG